MGLSRVVQPRSERGACVAIATRRLHLRGVRKGMTVSASGSGSIEREREWDSRKAALLVAAEAV